MIWFCEYSAEQQAFHIAPAGDCVASNCSILESGGEPSFVPVGLFESREKAVAFYNSISKKAVCIDGR